MIFGYSNNFLHENSWLLASSWIIGGMPQQEGENGEGTLQTMLVSATLVPAVRERLGGDQYGT